MLFHVCSELPARYFSLSLSLSLSSLHRLAPFVALKQLSRLLMLPNLHFMRLLRFLLLLLSLLLSCP